MSEDATARYERIRREHGPALARVVASYSRPGADHDDLAQEVALALWHALPHFRGDCPERAFVLRVAHNRALNHLFRKRPQGPESPPEQPDPRPSAESELDRRQQVARLYAAIRALPVGYRQVLTLALEELPHAEIAQVLGLSVDNVAVRLSRARAALKQRLTEEAP